jgi:hypothetical protein
MDHTHPDFAKGAYRSFYENRPFKTAKPDVGADNARIRRRRPSDLLVLVVARARGCRRQLMAAIAPFQTVAVIVSALKARSSVR